MMYEFFIESITWDSTFNPNSDITLYIRHGGAAFCICYKSDNLATSPSVLEQHKESYRILYKDDPGEGQCKTAERLRRPFEALMTQMAPDPPMESTGYLHSYLYPPSFILEAKATVNSCIQPCLKATLSRQNFVRPGEYVNQPLQSHLSPLLELGVKTYSSRQVQALAYTACHVPSKVLVDGTVYFFKPWRSGWVHGYYELQSYRKILADSGGCPPLLADAHICRLHGLIIDNDEDVLQHYPLDSDEEDESGTRLVGLLVTYIENRGTLNDLAPWSDCANKDRLRWSEQIHHSVRCLQDARVTWGDAKPKNVLIDRKGNAWLIDFGGSFTQGWVDEDKQETMEGDQQGVRRIDDWLAKWSCKPVPRVKRSDVMKLE